jgi:hypothetical protein
MTFFKDQVSFIKSPSSTLKRLATDPRALAIGFRNSLIIAILYEGAILLWAFGAEDVTLPAFLRIPEQQYYFYELIFLIPLFIVTWLLASAIAYVLSRAFGGSGSYDALLGGVGLTMAVSAYFTLIPDYIQGILWTTGWVPFYEYLEITGQGILLIIVWAYMLMYTLSHIVLYSMTVHYTQSLGKLRSFIVGIVSFILSFSVWITFVR